MAEPKTIPNGIKFLFGGLSGMGATLFVQVTLTQDIGFSNDIVIFVAAFGPGEDENASRQVKWSCKAKHSKCQSILSV